MLKTLYSKLLTLLILSTIIPVSTVGIYGIHSSSQALSNLNLNQVNNQVENKASEIERYLKDVREDLLFLTKTPPFQGVVRARENGGVDRETSNLTSTTYEDWIKRANTIIQALMLANPEYKSIRYLDELGNEMTWFEMLEQKPQLIPLEQRKNQASSIYFKPTINLKINDFFISPVTFEHILNDLSRPSVPVIYYATPIVNQVGKAKGVMVAALRVDAFTSLLGNPDANQNNYAIVDKSGNYLLHTNSTKVWNYQTNPNSNITQDLTRATTRKILFEPDGYIDLNNEELISHRAVALTRNNQLIILQKFPKEIIFKSANLFKIIAVLIIILSLSIVLAIGIPILRRISQQQTMLYQKAQNSTTIAETKAQELEQTLQTLKQTQSQLIQTEKMSSLGQLVAGVAHEINNPVSFIHGNLTHVQEYTKNLINLVQLYETYYPNPVPEIKAEVEEIDLDFVRLDLPKTLTSMKMGTDRIRQIVLSLRTFSRKDEAEFKAVDIHEGIDSTLLILQHRLNAKPDCPEIKVIRDYNKLPLVECYAGQLNQVLMNILANAIDALEEANKERMHPQIKKNPSQIRIHTSLLNANWVKIAIADNGLGIPEKVKQQIFNPFFTTKPIGKGTGMGMSISYQIITEKHGGKLEFSSTPEEGTEFIIKIPVRQQYLGKIANS